MKELGALGCKDAKTLNRTLFYILSQHFDACGHQEHHDLQVEELNIVKSLAGQTDYFQWTEDLTKIRKDGLSKPARRSQQKMFTVVGPRCHVLLLEMMLSKCPEELRQSGSLYLTPLRKPKPHVWYSKQPVGVYTVNNFMNSISS